MIPTFEEYEIAKAIVNSYELEQRRLINLKIENFRLELTEYFKSNLIDGRFELKEFSLEGDWNCGRIIPKNPCMEENYEGGNNEDIKKICEKHGVMFSIIYWCYHK